MGFKHVLLSPEPEPGELFRSFRDEIETDPEPLEKRVETLEEQKGVANRKLDFFLSNISDSPGAVKVVEQFYEEEHGKTIDASNVEKLRDEVPDIDSILYDNALPKVSKKDLRHHFGVEGVYGVEDENGSEIPYLTPEWVRKHDEEPYQVVETSGTTGKRWGRSMTRNDLAVVLLQGTWSIHTALTKKGINPKDARIVVIVPSEEERDIITQASSIIGAEVEQADTERILSGGDSGKEEAENLIRYLNSAEYSVIFSAVEVIMRGKLGVEIRRGNAQLDLVINAGKPIPDSYKNVLRSNDTQISDIFGETEHPQSGGVKTEREGKKGFRLPFESQINLIYDEDTQEVSYEGNGRFAYLPFGLEGQAIPGIYVSDVSGTVRNLDGKYQLLSEVSRVTDHKGACYQQ